MLEYDNWTIYITDIAVTDTLLQNKTYIFLSVRNEVGQDFIHF